MYGLPPLWLWTNGQERFDMDLDIHQGLRSAHICEITVDHRQPLRLG